MTSYECKKCDRTFTSKSHYVYHTEKLKTPCVNSNKKLIKEVPKKKIIKKTKIEDTESESDGDTDDESSDDTSGESDNETKIDVINHNKINDNMFCYKNHNFTYVADENKQIYFKGKEIAEFLEYSNTKQAIIEHVKDKHKIIYEKIRGLKNRPPEKIQKNSIFISEPGLYSLVMKSKKKEAEKFQDYVFETILPSIRKTGSYSMTNKSSIVNTSNILLQTSFFKEFYNMTNITKFLQSNVVYLGVIGLCNGILVKFGKSSRVIDREYLEHKKTFGEQFKIIHIEITDNNDAVENIFKKILKTRNLITEHTFNGKVQKELFTTKDDFTIDNAIDLLHKTVIENPSDEIKHKNQLIDKLENVHNDKELLMEKEKTKQLEEKTKQLVLELELQKEKIKFLQMEIDRDATKKETNYSITFGTDTTNLCKTFFNTYVTKDVNKDMTLNELTKELNKWISKKNGKIQSSEQIEKMFSKIMNADIKNDKWKGFAIVPQAKQ